MTQTLRCVECIALDLIDLSNYKREYLISHIHKAEFKCNTIMEDST